VFVDIVIQSREENQRLRRGTGLEKAWCLALLHHPFPTEQIFSLCLVTAALFVISQDSCSGDP